MYEVFNGLEYVRAYVDDLLIISNGNFEDHRNKAQTVLKKLKAAGLKINAEKQVFAKDNLEYLGFKITRQGIMPLPDKVQAIKDIAVPTNKMQLRSFIGVINYYRDMQKHRSDILTPLTKMTSKQATWNQTEGHQKAFEHIKNLFLEKLYQYIIILVNRL